MERESQGASNNQDSQHTESTCVSLLAKDLYLELLIIQHRASLKLIMLNGGQAHHHHRFMHSICNFVLNCTLLTSHIKIDIDIIRWFKCYIILTSFSHRVWNIRSNQEEQGFQSCFPDSESPDGVYGQADEWQQESDQKSAGGAQTFPHVCEKSPQTYKLWQLYKSCVKKNRFCVILSGGIFLDRQGKCRGKKTVSFQHLSGSSWKWRQ